MLQQTLKPNNTTTLKTDHANLNFGQLLTSWTSRWYKVMEI